MGYHQINMGLAIHRRHAPKFSAAAEGGAAALAGAAALLQAQAQQSVPSATSSAAATPATASPAQTARSAGSALSAEEVEAAEAAAAVAEMSTLRGALSKEGLSRAMLKASATAARGETRGARHLLQQQHAAHELKVPTCARKQAGTRVCVCLLRMCVSANTQASEWLGVRV